MTEASATLKRHAKTFFWAWLFLPRRTRANVAALYAFCRRVDDLADVAGDVDALERLRVRVAEGHAPDVLPLEAAGVRRAWLLDLIDGARSDLQFEQPADEAALDLYCYRVAGVVGLMMCPLIGVTEPAAWQHAVDLGCAMQLTNVARDVAEDLTLGRVYIPQTWGGPRTPGVVRGLLARAEGLYASGARGLGYIPWRTRLSVRLALAWYRAIGARLKAQDFDPFRGRAFVPWWRKLALAFKPLGIADVRPLHNLAWTSRRGLVLIQGRDDRRAIDDARGI